MATTSTFLLVAFFGNRYEQERPYLPFASTTQAVAPSVSINPVTHTPESKRAEVKKKQVQKKELRNKLRAFIQKDIKAGKGKGWGILVGMLAVVLLIVVVIGALACGQACTGSQTFGILALMVFL